MDTANHDGVVNPPATGDMQHALKPITSGEPYFFFALSLD